MKHYKHFLLIGIITAIPTLIYADTAAEEIPAAITTATDAEQSSITLPSNIITITRQQIQASGATNLMEVLQNQASIQALDLLGDGSTIALGMRGFGDNATSNSLILVNGYRLTNPDTLPPDLNSIPVDNIERIEIVPGSAAILYGSDAVGGVINIITRKPQQFMADLSAGYGSYQQKTYSGTIGDYFANGFNYQLTGLTDNTNNYRVHNQQEIQNISTQLGYDYHSGSIFFNYQNYLNNLQYAGALTAAQVAADPRQAQTNTNFDNQVTNNYQAGIKQQLNSDWLLQTSVMHYFNNGSGFVFAPFTERRVTDYVDPRLIGDVGNGTITTGIDLENDLYQYFSSALNSNVGQEQYSPFAQIVMPLATRLKLTLGARDAYQSSDGTVDASNQAFVTEEGLSWQLNPVWRLFATREGNYRFPKADEESALPIGVTSLKTQTGVSYEIGGEWQQEKNLVKLTLYQLRLYNEIAFNPLQTPTQPFGANQNLDPTLRNGLVLSSQYALNSSLILNGQYSYVDAQFASGPYSGNTIPFVATNLLNLGADYYFFTKTDLYVEQLYTGRRYAASDFSNVNGILGGYTVYNASLNYHTKNWVLSGRLNNILNKEFSAFTVYTPTVMADYSYPAPGRNFMLTVKYDFG